MTARTTRTSTSAPSVRPARRLPGRSWRDPRLLVGVLLVLGAAVGGARLLAAQDDSVAYWAVRDDVRAAGAVSADQLEPVRARVDGDAAQHLLPAEGDAPVDGRVWARDLPAGALVDAGALVPADEAGGHELPLRVETGSFPADLAAGELVDVWVAPAPGQGDPGGEARQVLEAARVVSAGSDDAALGQSARTVAVAVEPGTVQPDVVAAVSTGRVTLVRVR